MTADELDDLGITTLMAERDRLAARIAELEEGLRDVLNDEWRVVVGSNPNKRQAILDRAAALLAPTPETP